MLQTCVMLMSAATSQASRAFVMQHIFLGPTAGDIFNMSGLPFAVTLLSANTVLALT